MQFTAFLLALTTAVTPGAVPVTVMTPATAVAARTDRRPVAGGLYDAVAQQTFISWSGQFEDNYVQAYDHRTRTWSAPVRVAGGDNDSHNYPTMVQADDGHLLVFRGLHNRELWVARSPRPHSIAGEWTDTIIPAGLGATYPMPVKTADGTLFVFIRETAGDFDKTYPTDTRPMKYVRSTDNGRTWQSSATLTGDRWAIAPLNRADNMNEIYIGQLRYEPATLLHPERIGIVYTLAGGGPEDRQAGRDQPGVGRPGRVGEVAADEVGPARAEGVGEDGGGVRGEPLGQIAVDHDDRPERRRGGCCGGAGGDLGLCGHGADRRTGVGFAA